MIRYKAVKIREGTYKGMKFLALKLGISVIELIDRLYINRKEVDLDLPRKGDIK